MTTAGRGGGVTRLERQTWGDDVVIRCASGHMMEGATRGRILGTYYGCHTITISIARWWFACQLTRLQHRPKYPGVVAYSDPWLLLWLYRPCLPGPRPNHASTAHRGPHIQDNI